MPFGQIGVAGLVALAAEARLELQRRQPRQRTGPAPPQRGGGGATVEVGELARMALPRQAGEERPVAFAARRGGGEVELQTGGAAERPARHPQALQAQARTQRDAGHRPAQHGVGRGDGEAQFARR